jgi:DNA-binding response OmpR family regulator
MPENTATVLLVDDEPMVLKILGAVLTLHGYTVLQAEE